MRETTLPRPAPKAKKRKRRFSPLGDEISSVLSPTSDVEVVAATVLGEERTAKLVNLIRRVKLGELVGGVRPEPNPVHGPNTPWERRIVALLLMVLEHVSPKGRAWTKRLFRGRQRIETDDGTTVYVPGHSAGGLAARLKVSPREVDRYLQVLKHSGLLSVWQGPQDAPESFRGFKYAYAVFQWAGEVPLAIKQRLARRWGQVVAQVRRLVEAPAPRPGAPLSSEDSAAAALDVIAQLRARSGPAPS
jgi:hypothetical protein